MLLSRLQDLAAQHWRPLFCQGRTARRAISYGLGLLLAVGRKTVTSSILARGLEKSDWSADYKVFSRSAWDESSLFGPGINGFVETFREGPIPLAMDDTKGKKTGIKIPNVSWQRDPLSPPFATNFIRAQRFLQASALFPYHLDEDLPARGVPVAFEHAPILAKPGARASAEAKEQYRRDRKEQNLSKQSLKMMHALRSKFDAAGAAERTIIFALDGSFCNRTIFTAEIDRVDLLARTRKDAKLCFPAPVGSRRWYSEATFTPEQVRTDDALPYHTITLKLGGAPREVRYKEVAGVLWRTGAARRPLRLLVIAPQPYHVRGPKRLYRNPAYLLTTDLTTPAAVLLQIYIDRWQIEVNHREEKDLLGLGQAQAWSPAASQRHPTFLVALYSMLIVASLQEFGSSRTDAYLDLPRWRTNSARPSLLDLLRRLRKECNEVQNSPLAFKTSASTLLLAANG